MILEYRSHAEIYSENLQFWIPKIYWHKLDFIDDQQCDIEIKLEVDLI